MLKMVLFLFVLVGQSHAWAQLYYLGEGGYLRLNQEAASKNSVYPSGFSYGGGLGFRKNYFEFETLILKAKAEDDLLHDGVENKMLHEQTSLLLGLNFYLSKKFYARFGYGLHKIDQKLKTPVSSASEAGAKKEYNLKEDELSEGIYFGAGFLLYNGSKFALYIQADKYDYASMNSGAWKGSLGFRYYSD